MSEEAEAAAGAKGAETWGEGWRPDFPAAPFEIAGARPRGWGGAISVICGTGTRVIPGGGSSDALSIFSHSETCQIYKLDKMRR